MRELPETDLSGSPPVDAPVLDVPAQGMSAARDWAYYRGAEWNHIEFLFRLTALRFFHERPSVSETLNELRSRLRAFGGQLRARDHTADQRHARALDDSLRARSEYFQSHEWADARERAAMFQDQGNEGLTLAQDTVALLEELVAGENHAFRIPFLNRLRADLRPYFLLGMAVDQGLRSEDPDWLAQLARRVRHGDDANELDPPSLETWRPSIEARLSAIRSVGAIPFVWPTEATSRAALVEAVHREARKLISDRQRHDVTLDNMLEVVVSNASSEPSRFRLLQEWHIVRSTQAIEFLAALWMNRWDWVPGKVVDSNKPQRLIKQHLPELAGLIESERGKGSRLRRDKFEEQLAAFRDSNPAELARGASLAGPMDSAAVYDDSTWALDS